MHDAKGFSDLEDNCRGIHEVGSMKQLRDGFRSGNLGNVTCTVLQQASCEHGWSTLDPGRREDRAASRFENVVS